MGGPPLNSLILKPYFVGGPETVTGAFDVLRPCGVGVVDMVFTIGTHEQQVHALDLFAERILPTLHSWDHSSFPSDMGQLASAAVSRMRGRRSHHSARRWAGECQGADNSA